MLTIRDVKRMRKERWRSLVTIGQEMLLDAAMSEVIAAEAEEMKKALRSDERSAESEG